MNSQTKYLFIFLGNINSLHQNEPELVVVPFNAVLIFPAPHLELMLAQGADTL